MITTPELDLTPESAGSLVRFSQLFRGGRFLGLALLGGLGTTDVQTLYRVMDRIVSTAAGHDLCTAPDPLTPAERLAAAQTALGQFEQAAADWYDELTPEQQQAVIDLLRSIVEWLGAAPTFSAEAQAMAAALKSLLGLLLMETKEEKR
jgi:hypothetical protein